MFSTTLSATFPTYDTRTALSYLWGLATPLTAKGLPQELTIRPLHGAVSNIRTWRSEIAVHLISCGVKNGAIIDILPVLPAQNL